MLIQYILGVKMLKRLNETANLFLKICLDKKLSFTMIVIL